MTPSKVSNTSEPGRRGELNTPKIVFLVIAAAAPLVAMVGTVPISLAIGSGAGVPGTYLIAAVALLCFAVGYVAMSRRITSSSGFYAYIARGLGRPPAGAGGVLALVAYNTLVFALAGGVGYFAHNVVASDIGLTLPWWVWSLIAIAIVALLGHREIDLSAWVLGTLMVIEISMLFALNVAIIVKRGGAAFPATSFAPHSVFSGAPGVAIMFAFGSFAGFESAALYGKEARNPRRTIGRATYIAVGIIGVFYCFTSWMAVGTVGPAHVQAAVGSNPGLYFLGLAHDFIGSWMAHVLSWLIITSVFAAAVAVGAYTLWLRHRQPDRYAQIGSIAELSPAVDAELSPAVDAELSPRHQVGVGP